MRKLFTKQQIQVIMLLNVVLLIMLSGLVYMFTSGGNIYAGAGGEMPPIPHELIRNARVSANANILWETNIGGSKDESTVNVYYVHDRIYIFGNTQSSDLDFVSGKGGGFAAILNAQGATTAFTVFDYNIVKVKPITNGFALVGNQGKDGVVKLLNLSLIETYSAKLKSPHELLDLFIYGNNFLVVSQFFDPVLSKYSVMVTAFDSSLTKKYECLFQRTYSIDYITILPYKQGYMLVTNVKGLNNNFISFSPFDALNLTAQFKDVTAEYSFVATEVVPFSGGYAALVNKDGIPEIITVDNNLKKSLTKHLDCTSFDNSRLFSTGKNYYTFYSEPNSTGILTKINDSLVNDKIVDEANDFKTISHFSSNTLAEFIVGATASTQKLLCLSSKVDPISLTFATSAETNTKIVPLADGILAICESNKKSADVGGNFGGNDVWICKLKYPEFID